MAAQQRKALEQLIGTAPDIDILDPRVCRAYCVDFCVHDLLAGTKISIGKCSKMHIERFRLEYKAQGPIPNFERDFNAQLRYVLADCDARIADAESKLELSPEATEQMTGVYSELAALTAELVAGHHEVTCLGEQGLIAEALKQTKRLELVDAQRLKQEAKIRELSEKLGFSAHQKLQVCLVCGALLSSLDTDKRLADHFSGKMHQSCHLVRDVAAARALI